MTTNVTLLFAPSRTLSLYCISLRLMTTPFYRFSTWRLLFSWTKWCLLVDLLQWKLLELLTNIIPLATWLDSMLDVLILDRLWLSSSLLMLPNIINLFSFSWFLLLLHYFLSFYCSKSQYLILLILLLHTLSHTYLYLLYSWHPLASLPLVLLIYSCYMTRYFLYYMHGIHSSFAYYALSKPLASPSIISLHD